MKEEEENNWKSLKEHFEAYVTAKLQLLKLNFTEKTAALLAAVFSSMLTYMILGFCILFASIALAVFISEYTGHAYLGFLSIAGLYLLAFIILSIKRKAIIRKRLVNFLIRKIYEQ